MECSGVSSNMARIIISVPAPMLSSPSLSAELANLAFGFNVDVDKILDLLVDNEKENSVERNIALEAHEKLIEYARSNRGHFLRYSRAKGSIP